MRYMDSSELIRKPSEHRTFTSVQAKFEFFLKTEDLREIPCNGDIHPGSTLKPGGRVKMYKETDLYHYAVAKFGLDGLRNKYRKRRERNEKKRRLEADGTSVQMPKAGKPKRSKPRSSALVSDAPSMFGRTILPPVIHVGTSFDQMETGSTDSE